MEPILIYLLKASVGMALFYKVYWIFLRKETFHNANRLFLLMALTTAVVLPLSPIHYSVFVEARQQTNVLQTITDTFNNIPVAENPDEIKESFSWQQGTLLVYLTGAAIFLLRLLSQTIILIHLMIKYRVKWLDGVRIVENEKYGLPFSFFNIIFINPKFHTQADLPEILDHEKVHIRENHWFDLLFIELLTVIFWFNPFIWFFERSIKQNHEYLADKGVLAQGHTVGRYQALLVNQLMGMQIIGVTNNLNFALNTNRLKMMTKKKTSRLSGVKFVWTLPVLALLLFAFAEPNYQVKNSSEGYVEQSIENGVGSPQSSLPVKVIGKVTDVNGNPMPGTSVIVKGTSVGTVADLDGNFKLENVKNTASIVFSFVGCKTVIRKLGDVDVSEMTIKMEAAVILIDTEVPPPPPSAPKTKVKSSTPPPPPPPPGNVEKSKLKKGEKEREIFFVVEDMPRYKGGQIELALLVQKMQHKLATAKNIKGKAKVSFTVDAKGKVTDIKIVEKDNDLAGKGAYAIASEIADWTPGKQRGKAVPVKFLLPVEFK